MGKGHQTQATYSIGVYVPCDGVDPVLPLLLGGSHHVVGARGMLRVAHGDGLTAESLGHTLSPQQILLIRKVKLKIIDD